MPTLYAHLPYVRVEQHRTVPLSAFGVEIAPIAFEDWVRLDHFFTGERDLENRYQASEPAFAIVADASDQRRAEEAVECAHLAIVLGSAQRLPPPHISIQYLIGEGGGMSIA
jgi:hypothetical protein